MKKLAEIMEELGFRPEASDDVKKAFIKNLIRAANIDEIKRMKPDLKKVEGKADQESYQQISLFDQKISS